MLIKELRLGYCCRIRIGAFASVLVFLVFVFLNISTFLFANPPTYRTDNSSQRIISLSPPITEELYLLGVEDRVIGVTTYCQRPLNAQEKTKIGTVTGVNLEKVVSLNPDLVLATSLTDLKAIKKLSDLGIRVVSFPQVKNFNQICEQFLELGKIVGRNKEAEEIVSNAHDRIKGIKKKVENLPVAKVFVQIGANPLYTVTGDSFINDFIKFSGGTNVAQDSGSGLYNRERVLKVNPDFIIIVTMGIDGEDEKKIWQRFKTLNAVKNDRISIIDSSRICSPTPITFIKVLEDIVKVLHPSLEIE